MAHVAAEAQVQAVGEFGARPGVVRLKVGRADVDGGWVVWGSLRVDDADEGGLLRGVPEGVVLGVAADADEWLGAGDGAEVVEQVV